MGEHRGVNPDWLDDGMIVYVRPSLFGVKAKPGTGLRVTVVRAHGDDGLVEYDGTRLLLSRWDMWIERKTA